MIARTVLLMACLALAPAPVVADDVATTFRDVCVTGLLEHREILSNAAMGAEVVVAPSDPRYSGRQWRVGEDLWLKEMLAGDVTACELGPHGADEMLAPVTDAPARAERIWAVFEALSEDLTADGRFRRSGPIPGDGLRIEGLRSVTPSDEGLFLVIVISHHLASDFAFLMAAETSQAPR